MAYDPDNVFAKILRGEADAHVVLDEEHCVAFMDLMPQSPGHTLVIPPRARRRTCSSSAPAAWQAVSATTRRVAHAVQAAFEPAGMMLMQLNGRDAGQTVFHLHFHVVPRYEGEGLAFHARSMADPVELREHAARIRAELTPP